MAKGQVYNCQDQQPDDRPWSCSYWTRYYTTHNIRIDLDINVNMIVWIDDCCLLKPGMLGVEDYIGLDRADKSTRTSRFGGMFERGIFIRG